MRGGAQQYGTLKRTVFIRAQIVFELCLSTELLRYINVVCMCIERRWLGCAAVRVCVCAVV